MAAIETVFINGEEYELLDNNKFFIGDDRIKEAADKSPWKAVANGFVALVPGKHNTRQCQTGTSSVLKQRCSSEALKQC